MRAIKYYIAYVRAIKYFINVHTCEDSAIKLDENIKKEAASKLDDCLDSKRFVTRRHDLTIT